MKTIISAWRSAVAGQLHRRQPQAVEGCFGCGSYGVQPLGKCAFCDRRRALADRAIDLPWGPR